MFSLHTRGRAAAFRLTRRLAVPSGMLFTYAARRLRRLRLILCFRCVCFLTCAGEERRFCRIRGSRHVFLSRSGALVPVRRLRFLSLESRRGCAVMGPRRISRSRPHGSKAENVQEWYSIQNKNVFFVPLKKGMEMYNSCRKEHKFAQKPRLIANRGTRIHPLTVSNHHKKQRLISRSRESGRFRVCEDMGMWETGKNPSRGSEE